MSYVELVKKISPRLKGITHKLNGRFTFFSDEDLYQEALIRLWQDFNLGKLSDKTESYILQGCYFHLKNYIRKTADRLSLISLEALTDCDEQAQDRFQWLSSPFPLQDMQARFMQEKIAALPFNERERLILAMSIAGATVREIAAELGVSHVLVVRLRGRIRDRLRCLIEP